MSIIVAPFAYRAGKGGKTLVCDRITLESLAKKYGTPLYVYSAGAIEKNFDILDAAFRRIPHTLCYSVKANSNLSVLRLLARQGSGFDVVSGGELTRVLRAAPKAASKVVFSGVGKTAAEMDAALAARILMFNVESEGELALLADRAARHRKPARIAIRVNPNVFADTHPYISTGLQEHKFGVPVPLATELYRMARNNRHLLVTGISVHIGSQITDVQAFAAAMREVAALLDNLQSDGHRIRYIDAGGGLAIDYSRTTKRDFKAVAAAYAEAVMDALGSFKVHLLLEPGRTIVGPAGALLTQILYVKRNGKKRFLVVDAAMNDLLRPSLYRAYHAILPLRQGASGETGRFDVVGPVCESGDYLAQDRELPVLQQGDYLAILDAGAYGMSLSSNYNSRPRAAEVMVRGNSARIVRRRETMADLMATES